jgi:hypothetical protein
MLLEASNVNSHAELVGQDIDARCAKITAINLGLRGRYGWVLCGNTLSGETQFAYRIGSFYNETPHGLRRGVIRDVPPEQTPVPVLTTRVRGQTQSLLGDENTADVASSPPAQTIVEVPQWLARLEPKLAALEGDASSLEEPATQFDEQPAATDRPIEKTPPSDPPPTSGPQLQLF